MPDNQFDKEIAKRLQSLLKALEVGAEDLAKAIGMEKSNFYKVLKAERSLSAERAAVISTTYNVSMEWLIAGRGEIFIDSSEQVLVMEDAEVYKLSGTKPNIFVGLSAKDFETVRSSVAILQAAFLGEQVVHEESHPALQHLSKDKTKRADEGDKP